MKKIIYFRLALSLALSMLLIDGACVEYNNSVKWEELPTKSLSFIQQNFPEDEVSSAFVEREFLEVHYNVLLSDNTHIEFYKNGEWKEINCRNTSVPRSLIPDEILAKVDQMYSDAMIVEIDRDNQEYDIKLSNGVEMTFDKRYNLTDIDD